MINSLAQTGDVNAWWWCFLQLCHVIEYRRLSEANPQGWIPELNNDKQRRKNKQGPQGSQLASVASGTNESRIISFSLFCS
jgi:hypothetical protein